MKRMHHRPSARACGLPLLALLLALGSLPRPAQASGAPSPPRVNTQLLGFVVGAGLVTLGAVTAIALASSSARRAPDLQWPEHRETPRAPQEADDAPQPEPRLTPTSALRMSRQRSAPPRRAARSARGPSWSLRPERGGLMAVLWGEL